MSEKNDEAPIENFMNGKNWPHGRGWLAGSDAISAVRTPIDWEIDDETRELNPGEGDFILRVRMLERAIANNRREEKRQEKKRRQAAAIGQRAVAESD